MICYHVIATVSAEGDTIYYSCLNAVSFTVLEFLGLPIHLS